MASHGRGSVRRCGSRTLAIIACRSLAYASAPAPEGQRRDVSSASCELGSKPVAATKHAMDLAADWLWAVPTRGQLGRAGRGPWAVGTMSENATSA